MYYSIYSDPSDSWSNHWSNAPKQELKKECPVCGCTEFTNELFKDCEVCENCGHIVNEL